MRRIFLALEILCLLSFQNINAQDVYDIDPNPLSFYTEKYQRNVTLTAYGIGPDWSLELFQNNTLLVQLPNHKKVKAEIYAFQLDSIDHSTSYFGLVDNGYVQFTASKKTVEDPLTGTKYGYKAELHYHDTASSHYEYLQGFTTWIPNIKLEGTWLLTNINEEDYLNKYQYQLFQRLKFNFENNSISGFAGCSQLQGKFNANDQYLEIKNISLIQADKCQFSIYENMFLDLLSNKTFLYSIENGILKLSDQNNQLLFKSSY
ncbi:MAG TPA: META domain-containing protein [Chitinophagales bacterium]|nr:META domain-containing protein [Chitinophagales bacterium]